MGRHWNAMFGLGHPSKGTNEHQAVTAKGGNPFAKALKVAKKYPGQTQVTQADGSRVKITVNADGSTRVQHADGRDTTWPKGSNPS